MHLTTPPKSAGRPLQNIIFIFALTLVLFITGCSKKSDDPAPQDLKALLGARTWLVKSLNAIVDSKSYTSTTELASDEINFKPDGVYTDYDPVTKKTTTGTWTLSGKTLTIADSESSFYGEVSNLDAAGFVLSLPQVDVTKLDLTKDYSDITPADKDYINIYQIYLLFLGDFEGYDATKTPAKVQIVFNFKAK